MKVPPQEVSSGFADHPEDRTGSKREAHDADFLRWKHYEETGQRPTTQTYRDPVQDAVIRNLTDGRRKMKVTTTDEDGRNTTVFFDESASLSLIDHMAGTMNIRETRSRKGFRASMKDETPAVTATKQVRGEGPTE